MARQSTKKELEEEIARMKESTYRKNDDFQLKREKRKAEREQQIEDSLDDEDKDRLRIKWGDDYTWTEIVRMEQMYDEYSAEYEISVDREQVLKNICKTSLKMNQALDNNDIKDYKDLSSVFDQLRKSGKFTDSQKRDKKERDIDSIGQLVAFVEDEGGIIPQAPDPIEEPQDKIDFMIKDMKNYVDNLVKNELGLGNLIESYIRKSEQQKPKTVEDVMNKGFTQEEITQQDAVSFNQFLTQQMLDDNAIYSSPIGGDMDGFTSPFEANEETEQKD